MFFVKWNKEAGGKKETYRWYEIFYKLNNDKWKLHTGARATKQKYISIYIVFCMKTFLKMGVCVYIFLVYYSFEQKKKT